MVLTQHEMFKDSEELTEVSIPLWFSRNREAINFLLKTVHVSIPLWFSRNERPSSVFDWLMDRFHTTMVLTQHARFISALMIDHSVSIPLWFSRNQQRLCGSREKQPVSIPLWFSRNTSPMRKYSRPLRFPYHSGSHATAKVEVIKSTRARSFHTTMVLTQRYC